MNFILIISLLKYQDGDWHPKAQWSLYVPPSGLYMYAQNIQQFYLLPLYFMCFLLILDQTANISLYNINWLDFITEI